MAKKPKKLSPAAQRLIDAHQVPKDEVIPYDPETYRTVMEAVAARYDWQQKQYRNAARDCYIEAVPWFRAAYHEAVLADDHEKAVNAVFVRAGLEWQERTGKPALHMAEGWKRAIIGAGYDANVAGIVPTNAGLIATMAVWAAMEWERHEPRKTQAPPEPTETLPALTADDAAILRELLAKSPVLVVQADLEAATVISRKTLGKRLQKLTDDNLVTRPEGERGGYGLTDAGQKIAVGLVR